jgi:hypothetical protein
MGCAEFQMRKLSASLSSEIWERVQCIAKIVEESSALGGAHGHAAASLPCPCMVYPPSMTFIRPHHMMAFC